eukprot:339177-Hanusia_phi.AAC.1
MPDRPAVDRHCTTPTPTITWVNWYPYPQPVRKKQKQKPQLERHSSEGGWVEVMMGGVEVNEGGRTRRNGRRRVEGDIGSRCCQNECISYFVMQS